jgi:hypothetical protein
VRRLSRFMRVDCPKWAGMQKSSIIRTHVSRWLGPNVGSRNALHCRSYRRRSQDCDEPQNVGEQISRNCDLRQLERDLAAMADDLRADLDKFLLQSCHRPVFDRFPALPACAGCCPDLSAGRVKLQRRSFGSGCLWRVDGGENPPIDGAPLPPEDVFAAAAFWGSADPLERSARDAS